MVYINQCPVCAGSSFTPLHSCLDTTVSHETFAIQKCVNCRLGITSPRPDDSELDKYYHSEEYISHSGRSEGITGKLYVFVRKFTLKWKHALVEKHVNAGTILDFGCGTGEFLQFMKKNNWNILGIEPSSAGRQKAVDNTGERIFTALDELSNQKIDVISLWHVLEHIPDVNEALRSFHKILDKQGALFIAVPNYTAADALYYKEFWAGYDVPRHLWHFTFGNMKMLLTQNGFALKSIEPMKLDAYYVSLLSEKNRKRNPVARLLNAFLQGAKSNLKARKTTNYSSVIYIATPL